MNNDKVKSLSWFLGRPKSSGFIVFLSLFAVVIFIVHQRYSLIVENDKREMSNLLNVAYNNVEQSLKNAANSALTLAFTINDQGKPQQFEAIGSKILESNPGIDAVQLVPNGVIRYTYPLKGNEAALGLDILKSAYLRKDAIESIKRRKMYFAGPLQLKQGGIGVVGRLPIFKDDRFWGFSAVLIKLETLLKNSGIQSIDESKHYFQLSMTDSNGKENYLLPIREDFSTKYYDSLQFTDSTWKLYIITRNENAVYYHLLPLFLIGTVVAMLFGLLIRLLLEKPAQLKKLVIKQAEKILANEVKYKSMFTQATIGIANIDSNTGQILEINEPYCRIIGYTKAEIQGRKLIEITHPDDVAENLNLLKQLREGTVDKFSFEKRYLTKSGAVVWTNLTVSPLWEPGEIPSTHMAIVEDITLKKEIKEKIAKSEARFKSLFDDSPIALWEEDFSEVKKYIDSLPVNAIDTTPIEWFRANPDVVRKCISLVKIIDVNNECLKFHHPKTKKQLLVSLDSLLDDCSSEVFIKQLSAIATGKTQFTTDSTIVLASGETRDISLRWSVMPSYEDTLERVIVSTEDITAQKESQRLVLNSRQRLENLVNSIDGIVWECDADTLELHFISKKTFPILGYTVAEWSADVNFWQNHIHPDDRKLAFDTFLQIAKEKAENVFEYRMISKAGAIIWIREMVTALHEDGITILRGIMIDITQNKVAEHDLNSSFELVTEQKKRLMNFSFIVSHNLRSHAANIQLITTFIESADDDEQRNEMIGMLKTVTGSLNETLLNLNDLINVQENVSLVSKSLSLREYVDNTLNILSEEIIAKKAIINNNISDINVEYYPAYLESILLNLISNALRYSKLDENPVITIDWIQSGNHQILKVSDEGIGIDLKKHGDKIFGLYKTFNGNADARGIGLFMTRTQIEAMGGQIMVESELGKGTTFTIHLN